MIRDVVSVAIVCFALGARHDAAAQAEKSAVAATDTTEKVVVIDPGLSLGVPILLLPPSLHERKMFVVPSFVTQGSPGQRLPFLMEPPRQNIDLLAPLHLQWEREEKLRPLYTVLGTVQLGGVAYIAYLHTKKYGLLK